MRLPTRIPTTPRASSATAPNWRASWPAPRALPSSQGWRLAPASCRFASRAGNRTRVARGALRPHRPAGRRARARRRPQRGRQRARRRAGRARRRQRALLRLRRQPGRARDGRCPAPGHARRRSRRERRARRPRVRQHRRPGWISGARSPSAPSTRGAARRTCASSSGTASSCAFDRRVPLAGAVASTAQPFAAARLRSLQPQAEARGEALELKDFFDEAGLSFSRWARRASFPQARIPGSQPRKR